MIINNRVGTGRSGMEGLDKSDRSYAGDFGTPEQQIPATGLAGVDWESCMTMNDTWGFKAEDQNWKSDETLIRNLIDIASKGGNYLLNVGPTAEGLIPPPSVERLGAIGQWMKVNGESIFGTQASPFEKTPWGRCTQKTVGDGVTRVYFHLFQWPSDGRLVIPQLPGKAVKAQVLGSKSPYCSFLRRTTRRRHAARGHAQQDRHGRRRRLSNRRAVKPAGRREPSETGSRSVSPIPARRFFSASFTPRRCARSVISHRGGAEGTPEGLFME